MKSSVVIVNWNSGDRLKACLESLPTAIETVVIDNASQDDSIAQARPARPTTRFVSNATNRGLSAGLNQGFAATFSPFVLVLNPDVRMKPGSLEQLERILEQHPRAGLVGGYVNEKYLPRRLATPWTVVRENCGLPVSTVNEEKVGQAAAAAILVRREAYAAIGGFDERFVPAWYEDVDFCKSLHVAGWDVYFAREAQFVHEGGYSARALGASAFAAAYYRNQLRYIGKHFGAGASLLVRLSIVAGMTARLIASPSKAAAFSKVIVGALGRW